MRAALIYTAWILAAVGAGLVWPEAFVNWGGVELRDPRVVLIVVQLVMFGMGTQMRLADFQGVVREPRGVLVGLACQFTIMPLLGWAISRVFRFPDEVAAGIVLIGSCSSGLASNVMTYLAKANLALSVTVTACATLLAPLITPLWMKLLAGRLVEVSAPQMMLSILQMVVLPVAAALVINQLVTVWQPARAGWERLRRWMPLVSMAGIVYFTAVTTAAGRSELLQVGPLLLVASVLHNGLGYGFGYAGSRLAGLDVPSARAMALEVGLQNGGMASGLAGQMGKLGTVGLAAAVFSPWMNVSGGLLAGYWARTSPEANPDAPRPTSGHLDHGLDHAGGGVEK
jgi:BASS family bile acid:Na+ symporter